MLEQCLVWLKCLNSRLVSSLLLRGFLSWIKLGSCCFGLVWFLARGFCFWWWRFYWGELLCGSILVPLHVGDIGVSSKGALRYPCRSIYRLGLKKKRSNILATIDPNGLKIGIRASRFGHLGISIRTSGHLDLGIWASRSGHLDPGIWASRSGLCQFL